MATYKDIRQNEKYISFIYIHQYSTITMPPAYEITIGTFLAFFDLRLIPFAKRRFVHFQKAQNSRDYYYILVTTTHIINF